MNSKQDQYLGNPNLKKGHTQSRFSKNDWKSRIFEISRNARI